MTIDRKEIRGKVITLHELEIGDGSKIHDVGLVPNSGHGAVIFNCPSEEAAHEVIDLLEQAALLAI